MVKYVGTKKMKYADKLICINFMSLMFLEGEKVVGFAAI